MSHSHEAKGYTLVELIVVVVLLGLVFTFSIPSFRNSVFSSDLNYSARRIIGLVKGLREKALREQAAIRLNFDFDEQRFSFSPERQTEEPFSLTGDEPFILPADVRVSDIWTRNRGKQTGGEMYILISDRGYIEQAVVHLKSADGREISLELTPFLGTIRVFDKYVDFAGG